MFHIDSFESIKNGRGRPKITAPSEREHNMKDMFLHGKTLQEIGDLQTPPISRERVRQLLKKFFNIIGNDGGCSLRTFPIILAKLKDKKERKEKKYQRMFGCSSHEFIKINGSEWDRKKRTLGAAFYSQKYTANARGIKFDLTFPEWFKIWQESGKLELRGRGAGYCMARIGDTGGYSKDNVEIITIGQNFSDSYYKYPHRKSIKKLTSYKHEFCKN